MTAKKQMMAEKVEVIWESFIMRRDRDLERL